MPEVLTETDGEWAEGDYGDFLGLTTEERAIVERRAERARLEREVIARAKEFTDDKVPRENWDGLVAYRELCRAVDALIDFESKQQQIKK